MINILKVYNNFILIFISINSDTNSISIIYRYNTGKSKAYKSLTHKQWVYSKNRGFSEKIFTILYSKYYDYVKY